MFNINNVKINPYKTTPKPLIKIRDMPENELYYTAYHAFRVDKKDNLWVNSGFRCSITARTDRVIPIMLKDDGFIHLLPGYLDPYNLKEYNGSKIYLKCIDPGRLKKEDLDETPAKKPGFRWF